MVESFKRRADTQQQNPTQCTGTAVTQVPAEPLSSQLSALLFSSSPPAKSAKLAVETKEEKDEFDLLMMGDDDDDLDDLLNELDKGDNVNNNADNNVNKIVGDSGNNAKRMPNSLEFCTTALNSGYSAADSVYETRKTMLLPMIDISTPQVFSQQVKHAMYDKNDIDKVNAKKENILGSQCSLLSQEYNIAQGGPVKLLIAETFNLDDLKCNLRRIDGSLHLNAILAIRASMERRVAFPLALMLRDFRQIGAMGQLRLLDGAGSEIIGTVPFTACVDLKIKLHFGLILVLTDVSVFSPVPGTKYLNITKGNIQSFHYNTGVIE